MSKPRSITAVQALALATLLALGALACSGTSSTGGKSGGLALDVIVSATDDFVANWGNPKRMFEASVDQVINVGFGVSGYATDKNGSAALRVDVEVFDPGGKSIHRQDSFASYEGKRPLGEDSVLTQPTLYMTMDEGDPLGTYVIKAVATDLISGNRTEGQASVNVVAP